jgi:hypothetical protein
LVKLVVSLRYWILASFKSEICSAQVANQYFLCGYFLPLF